MVCLFNFILKCLFKIKYLLCKGYNNVITIKNMRMKNSVPKWTL